MAASSGRSVGRYDDGLAGWLRDHNLSTWINVEKGRDGGGAEGVAAEGGCMWCMFYAD